ncbi:hypothetical protein N7468_000986 [Penicillium chermesinum]|uniref:Uncharacterized protein n=1 Tax=Penicillium chermesinum TaxID=63820 RepID=A0A9W9PFR0_9EURO|nr:uncharacterized protein N7468_000986 [Penicillium chermesinum]KAJ5246003.1 hypothetical protein N7468_000986 [Penicillium chermesinum]KAJ6144300.1 hypothetical protein N7470_008195 [Penicillium chermesinum]
MAFLKQKPQQIYNAFPGFVGTYFKKKRSLSSRLVEELYEGFEYFVMDLARFLVVVLKLASTGIKVLVTAAVIIVPLYKSGILHACWSLCTSIVAYFTTGWGSLGTDLKSDAPSGPSRRSYFSIGPKNGGQDGDSEVSSSGGLQSQKYIMSLPYTPWTEEVAIVSNANGH